MLHTDCAHSHVHAWLLASPSLVNLTSPPRLLFAWGTVKAGEHFGPDPSLSLVQAGDPCLGLICQPSPVPSHSLPRTAWLTGCLIQPPPAPHHLHSQAGAQIHFVWRKKPASGSMRRQSRGQDPGRHPKGQRLRLCQRGPEPASPPTPSPKRAKMKELASAEAGQANMVGNHVHVKTCTWTLTSALLKTAKTWKQPTCPSVEPAHQ
ncbi:uncharacterized protein LOC129397855 [Pan paniscus]|uniref:uncharacterized protein LOC129397855 n=1 Tax=Pan paniscus TaxID=9597 RepID=UPI0024371AE4|nr:uncharacterized protein LOC129397855 [Pan paniscus]